MVALVMAGASLGAGRGQLASGSPPGPSPWPSPGPSPGPESLQQMKRLMEQEMKNDKYKTNSNKGYVFTLMPLYAIGVGVFAAYKFLKVKQAKCVRMKRIF